MSKPFKRWQDIQAQSHLSNRFLYLLKLLKLLKNMGYTVNVEVKNKEEKLVEHPKRVISTHTVIGENDSENKKKHFSCRSA